MDTYEDRAWKERLEGQDLQRADLRDVVPIRQAATMVAR